MDKKLKDLSIAKLRLNLDFFKSIAYFSGTIIVSLALGLNAIPKSDWELRLGTVGAMFLFFIVFLTTIICYVNHHIALYNKVR